MREDALVSNASLAVDGLVQLWLLSCNDGLQQRSWYKRGREGPRNKSELDDADFDVSASIVTRPGAPTNRWEDEGDGATQEGAFLFS